MEALIQKVSYAWAYMTGHSDKEYRIGKYKADYSPLSVEEIQANDEDLNKLYADSKPVSRAG